MSRSFKESNITDSSAKKNEWLLQIIPSLSGLRSWWGLWYKADGDGAIPKPKSGISSSSLRVADVPICTRFESRKIGAREAQGWRKMNDDTMYM